MAFVNVDWKVVVGTIDGKALALTLDTDELIVIAGERLAQGPSEDEYQFYAIDSCPTPERLYSGRYSQRISAHMRYLGLQRDRPD